MTMARIMASKLSKKAFLFATLAIIICVFTACLTAAEDTINDDITEQPQSGDNNNNGRNSQQYSPPPLPLLDSESVVLITGAAGFIGSELALALKRTYNVKKLLLVDHLGMESDNESYFVPPPKDAVENTNAYTTEKAYEKYDKDTLSLFELKRQRIFRIFQEITAVNLDGNSSNYNNADSIKFYRADMRPSIPEFFDMGELPLLEGIFESHPDITHVVHLADDDVTTQNQAIIPRNRDSVKTSRMEGILEQMRLILERRAMAQTAADEVTVTDDAFSLPQLVYASSYEVYDYLATSEDTKPNPLPFREDKPISTPSSLHGASKLIDEILASAYHSTHGIYSVGLRFFPVYGPWDNPGADIFDLAEEICFSFEGDNVEDSINYENGHGKFDEDLKDYVFIDDAVDAIMSAMQYRPPSLDPSPVVFNVGTGEGTSLKQIRDEMMSHFPPNSFDLTNRSTDQRGETKRQATISYASTELAKIHLGFKAQVPLSVGIAKTLKWLRSRSTPYGNDSELMSQQKRVDSFVDDSLAKATGEDCSPFDRECLRGAPVFPCVSECSNADNCTPSVWDEIASISRSVTSGCDAVMFTILLDRDAEQIPSAVAVNATSLSFVRAGLNNVGERTTARCNIAFVSEDSPLVQRLRSQREVSSENNVSNKLAEMIRHGFWTLLPLPASSSWMHAFSGSYAIRHLPKLSPRKFFGSSVRYAIYVEPSILVMNLPKILKQIDNSLAENDRTIAMMTLERRQSCDAGDRALFPWSRSESNDYIQRTLHNMVRVSLKGDLVGGGLTSYVDSSLLVHSLWGEDARMLRCDVYSESAQWGVSSDENSLDFILSLHDFWSRASNHWSSSAETGSAKTENTLHDDFGTSSVLRRRRSCSIPLVEVRK